MDDHQRGADRLLAYDESTDGLFSAILEEQNGSAIPLPDHQVIGTALHLWRVYALSE